MLQNLTYSCIFDYINKRRDDAVNASSGIFSDKPVIAIEIKKVDIIMNKNNNLSSRYKPTSEFS
ncbi:MAG: hypothetical protein DLM72_11360 [Candidatus Nitrosopolaris wilkensis]|nr:MAG: hypothetical protein DLM72_11360 [Candidatus Nitrosopolaris wilkensis]